MKDKVKKLLLIFGVTILVVVTVLFVISSIKKSQQVTDLELQAFEEKSTKLMNFFEEIDNEERDNPSKQAVYAFKTLNAESGKKEYSLDEIQQKINASFTNPENIAEYEQSGKSLDTSNTLVFYNDTDKIFSAFMGELSHKEIINTPITKYVLVSVKKQKNNYVANYEKYVFEEPYMIIDRTSQDDTKGEHSVKDYLEGKGTVLALKELVNNTNAKDICEPEKTITVTFHIDNDTLKIAEYK